MQQQQTSTSFKSNTWDIYSEKYAKKIQKNTSVFGLTLLNLVRYEEVDKILDAGCGAGYLHQQMVLSKKQTTHLYGFDISEQMVLRAAARMKRFLNQQIGQIDNLTQNEVKDIKLDEKEFNEINYHLSVGSVDDLSQYQNNFFDIYICNLVLQNVPDQSKALKEAYRVLKPGGKIAFSVWGKYENCHALWFLKEIAFQVGLCQVGMQGRFIKDEKELIKLVQDCGFKNILCWEQINPFDIMNIETVEDFFNPEIDNLLEQATEQQRNEYYNALENKIKEYTNQYKPLCFDCYLVYAEKEQ